MPNDMTGGFSCNFIQHPDNFIREDNMIQPITPDWCPLITKNILLTMNNEEYATIDNILKIILQPPFFQWNIKL